METERNTYWNRICTDDLTDTPVLSVEAIACPKDWAVQDKFSVIAELLRKARDRNDTILNVFGSEFEEALKKVNQTFDFMARCDESERETAAIENHIANERATCVLSGTHTLELLAADSATMHSKFQDWWKEEHEKYLAAKEERHKAIAEQERQGAAIH